MIVSSQASARWEIGSDEIVMIRLIEDGLYGELWEGLWNKTKVSVKKNKPEKMSLEEFQKEAALMKRLRHPRVIWAYAVCIKDMPHFIVFEEVKIGNLLEYLRNHGHSLQLSQLVGICCQIASGMAYLDLEGCVHGDLAAHGV